jgi:hypothetical protein
MSALEELLKLLNQIPAWKRMSELPDRVDTLEKRLAELEKQKPGVPNENEYLDLGRCSLRKKPTGGYFDTPLCPTCKKPLSQFGAQSLGCGTCAIKLRATDVMAEVRNVLRSLE